MNPIAPDFETVLDDGSFTVEDSGDNPVLTAYHIPTVHCDDMLIVHVPGADGGIVFNSDMWNPLPNANPQLPQGFAFNPDNITELHDGIVARIIDNGGTVNTLVGGHGVIGPFSDLVDAVSTSGN